MDSRAHREVEVRQVRPDPQETMALMDFPVDLGQREQRVLRARSVIPGTRAQRALTGSTEHLARRVLAIQVLRVPRGMTVSTALREHQARPARLEHREYREAPDQLGQRATTVSTGHRGHRVPRVLQAQQGVSGTRGTRARRDWTGLMADRGQREQQDLEERERLVQPETTALTERRELPVHPMR